MTPPQKKVHHGRIKASVGQILALAEALRGLNPSDDSEVEIRMSFRVMEAKVTTKDGISLGMLTGTPDNERAPMQVKVVPLAPTA